jgi:dihydrofolate reductase
VSGRQEAGGDPQEDGMGKLMVVNGLSLDGVMQAPALAGEDQRDGFEHGGWAVPYNDEVMGRAMSERMASHSGGLLLGRRTYEGLYGYWPHQTDGNPYTEVLNRVQKYVASRTLTEPLPWQNSTLLKGDAADAVAELKARGEDLTVLGSGDLLQSLMRRGLVDQYLLSIHPLVLGSGRRMFAGGATFGALRLVDSITTTTGVIMATYEPA